MDDIGAHSFGSGVGRRKRESERENEREREGENGSLGALVSSTRGPSAVALRVAWIYYTRRAPVITTSAVVIAEWQSPGLLSRIPTRNV